MAGAGEGEVSEEDLRVHVAMLEGPRHPEAGEGLDQAAEYVAGAMGRAGLETTEHEFEVGRRRFRNVVGRVGRREGLDLLVAAHYDTVPGSPGADDNASGVAVMLEVSRLVAPLRLGGGVEFVALCMGEAGGPDRPGSRAYAEDLRALRLDLLGAVVMEGVGFTAPTQGQEPGVELPPRGDFLAVLGNPRSRALAEAFGEVGPEVGLRTATIAVGGRGRGFGAAQVGDHVPFWDLAFRAIVLTDTGALRNPHWQAADDTHDTLDFAFMGRVAAALQEFILRRVGLA